MSKKFSKKELKKMNKTVSAGSAVGSAGALVTKSTSRSEHAMHSNAQKTNLSSYRKTASKKSR